MILSQSIAAILDDRHALYADDLLLLLETPERIAKLREIFKVGGSRWGDLDPQGRGYEGGIYENDFDAILRADPTARIAADGTVAKCGIYSQWLCGLFTRVGRHSKELFIEDLYKATDALTLYDKFKSKLPVEKRNIMAVKSVIELEQIVAPFKDEQTKGDETRAIKAGTQRLLDDADWLVLIPTTHDAACFYGANTRWCTASRDSDYYFRNYTKRGPLYVCINKADNEKFQLHFESRQFMDEQDSQIDATEFFKENQTVSKAIVAQRKGAGTLTGDVLEMLDPVGLLEEYGRTGNTETRVTMLKGISAGLAVRGFEEGYITAEDLNATDSGVRFAGKAPTGKIGYVVDDWSDLSCFCAEEVEKTFEEIVGGDGISSWYDYYPAIGDALNYVNEKDKARIAALCAAMEQGIDEDGDVEWDDLPDEVDTAVRTAASRAEEQATYDMYHKKYTEAVEEVAGKADYGGEGLVLWNSAKTFAGYVECARSHAADRDSGERLTLDDVMKVHAQALRAEGEGADPGDSRYWYSSTDQETFDEYLNETLGELEAEYLKKEAAQGAPVAAESRLVSRLLRSERKARTLIERSGQFGYDLDPDTATDADLEAMSDKDRVTASNATSTPRVFKVKFRFKSGSFLREVTASSASAAVGLALHSSTGGKPVWALSGYASAALARHAIKTGAAQVTVTDERFKVQVPVK